MSLEGVRFRRVFPLTLSLSRQSRLGEIATYGARIRKRMRRERVRFCVHRAEVQASLLLPHPLADAVILGCKLAKASLLGEGQVEGWRA